MLLDDYWQRMNLKVPIYFSAGKTSLLVPYNITCLLTIGCKGNIFWSYKVNCDWV